jgi:hypothetical protein
MISDVLHDAVASIEGYQDPREPYQDWYGDLAEEIEAVKAPMRTLREFLDGCSCVSPADLPAHRANLRERLGLPPAPDAKDRPMRLHYDVVLTVGPACRGPRVSVRILQEGVPEPFGDGMVNEITSAVESALQGNRIGGYELAEDGRWFFKSND